MKTWVRCKTIPKYKKWIKKPRVKKLSKEHKRTVDDVVSTVLKMIEVKITNKKALLKYINEYSRLVVILNDNTFVDKYLSKRVLRWINEGYSKTIEKYNKDNKDNKDNYVC